jgi:hypothetical protein
LLTIANPITTPNSRSAAGFGIALNPSAYAPTALISNPNPLDVITPIIPPAIVNGIVTIPKPEGVRIRTLTIGGQTYTYTLISPPPAGQFTDLGGQLLIGYLGLVPPPIISYYLSPIAVRTDRVMGQHPDLLTQFPIQGELTWTLNWEEQPSASFEFITLASKKADLIEYFTHAQNIDIYGVGFATSGQLSITEISLTKSAIPLIKVSVNLTGCHARFLDIYTFLGKQLYLPNCQAAPTPQLNSPDSMTIQDLALKVGTSIIGTAIAIDKNILNSPAVATTLGSNLESSSIRGIGAFIKYDRTDAIELRQYDQVPSHYVDESDIRSDISTSINHKIGTNFYKTYDPLTKVQFGSNTYTAPTSKAKPEWQPVPLVSTETSEGDPNPEISPYAGVQKDLSIVFDISGKRKRRKDIKLINGQPISEVEQEWGYVAVGKDDIVFDANANAQVVQINGSWQKIESKTTNYIYNSKGYLISVVSTGSKKTRFRTENAQKPESLAVRITATNPDPGEVAQLQTFRFFNLPIATTETYELEPMSAYYSDIKPTQTNYTICLADGSGTIDIPVTDQAYIPPYFVKVKRVVTTGSASVVNPKSTALSPLPNLTTGKSSEFTERIVIEQPPILSTSITGEAKDPTYYTKSTDNYNSEGAQFSTVLSIAESSLVNGRPPVATNRGAILQLVQPPTNPTTPTTPNTSFAIKSGLSSENLGYVTVGSISFPTATNQQQAIKAAQIDIDIINIKNTQTETMLINFRPQIRPGDRLEYRIGSGAVRSRRVISVSNKLKIEGMIDGAEMIVTTAGTEVKLGVESESTPVVVVNLPSKTTTIAL